MRKALTLAGLFGVVVSVGSSVQGQAGRGQAAAPQALLNRAADAVLALKSAQFTLTREGAPAFLDERNGITFTTAQCSYAAPDRVSCDVKVSSKAGMILQLTRVWVPEGTFQSNPLTKQFMQVPADMSFNGVVLFARNGIPEVLRTGVLKPQLVGTETVRDRSTLHLRGEVPGDRLNALMGSAIKAEGTYPVDLWMEEQSGNPVRIDVTEPGNNGWVIDLFALNEPVTIPTPKVPPPAPAPGQ